MFKSLACHCVTALVASHFVVPVIHADETGRAGHDHKHADHCEFSIRSVKDGRWLDAKTWKPARVPGNGDRVLISRGTFVEYDAKK